MLRTARLSCVVLLLAATQLACGEPEPDASQVLEPVEVITGWLDKGIVNGQNKLVPTISFKIRNKSDQPISSVQLNAVFRVVGDPEELGARLVRGIPGAGLMPKTTTANFVLSSDLGYTSEGSRVQMLQNSQFRDAQVELFAKHGSRQWVKLAERKIDRQLLEQ
jgi:hypothetical protein